MSLDLCSFCIRKTLSQQPMDMCFVCRLVKQILHFFNSKMEINQKNDLIRMHLLFLTGLFFCEEINYRLLECFWELSLATPFSYY